jgi:uroporphyrinogen-III decarboxylase
MTEKTESQLLYEAREKRFTDAVSLKRPDRVPLVSLTNFFLTRYGGITDKEAMYDYGKMREAWLTAIKKLNWDFAPGIFTFFPGKVLEMMGSKAIKWAGHGLGENILYQYIDKEYMLANEYDEFLNDPSGFVITKFLPRVCEVFEPLEELPPIPWLASGYTAPILGATLAGMPHYTEMMKKLVEVGKEMIVYNTHQAQLVEDVKQMGYPMTAGAYTEAPFDYISDFFRGLNGTMLDMYRQPDKLKAAVDYVVPHVTQFALNYAAMSGNPRVEIPLHRGSAAFMSDSQFEEFYWPGLKKLLLALIDAELTPIPFFEGDVTPRLKYLAELPPGKVAAHFDIVDKKKFKEILGDKMVFWGDVPGSLLVTGKPQQIKDYVKALIDMFSDTGALIIDGAIEGVPPESKPENVEAMTEAVHEFGVY